VDICTLTLVTTLLCTAPPPPHCEVSNGKQYCDMQAACGPAPDPYYTCKRADGTTYTEPLLSHPAFRFNVY